jgi:hypothetical protein
MSMNDDSPQFMARMRDDGNETLEDAGQRIWRTLRRINEERERENDSNPAQCESRIDWRRLRSQGEP